MFFNCRLFHDFVHMSMNMIMMPVDLGNKSLGWQWVGFVDTASPMIQPETGSVWFGFDPDHCRLSDPN